MAGIDDAADRLGYLHVSMLLFTVVGVVPPGGSASLLAGTALVPIGQRHGF